MAKKDIDEDTEAVPKKDQSDLPVPEQISSETDQADEPVRTLDAPVRRLDADRQKRQEKRGDLQPVSPEIQAELVAANTPLTVEESWEVRGNAEVDDSIQVNPLRAKKAHLVWIALLVLVGIAVTWFFLRNQEGEGVDQQSVTAAEIDDEIQENASAGRLLDQLEKATRDYCNATNIEEMAQVVRQSERVEPLMRDYYSRFPFEVDPLVRTGDFNPITFEQRGDFWLISALRESGKVDHLILEGTEMGAKVDWETHVVYQPIDWDQFTNERIGEFEGNFRVIARLDHHYSHEFRDSEKYLCLRLSAANSKKILFGYIPRGGELENRFLELMPGGPAEVPLILTLRIPEDLESPNGALVTDLVTTTWMFVEDPSQNGD